MGCLHWHARSSQPRMCNLSWTLAGILSICMWMHGIKTQCHQQWYVGVLWLVIMFSNFYKLDVHTGTCISKSTMKHQQNQIQNRTSFYLVTYGCEKCMFVDSLNGYIYPLIPIVFTIACTILSSILLRIIHPRYRGWSGSNKIPPYGLEGRLIQMWRH